jgi:hypothetical protein
VFDSNLRTHLEFQDGVVLWHQQLAEATGAFGLLTYKNTTLQ